ncbi:MAG: hypothetical protein QGG40_20460 [Myxococcota bacterium]|nr:hypothetical protein [Myxococcota bacterium]
MDRNMEHEPIRDEALLPADPEETEQELPPAFFSGTSTEFLGRKPLPLVVRQRPVIFVMGPGGVGKTEVARFLVGSDAVELSAENVDGRVLWGVRTRNLHWPDSIRLAPNLIIDCPYNLEPRMVVRRAVVALLEERIRSGRRTIVCERDDVAGIHALSQGLAPVDRAVVALRYPVGRGRRKYAVKVCEELGIGRRHARVLDELDPWSYRAIHEALVSVRDGGTPIEVPRRRKKSRRRP